MSHASSFNLGGITLGGGPLFLIAGPCVIESEPHARRMADAIQRIASDLRIPYIFKASYDKANRTSIHSFRGPGIEEGARILRLIAEQNRLPVLTDIHTAEQAAELSDRLGPVDAMLQIPAFLCRQTDLLIAAARACASPNRAVNVKKGQFVAPWDMRHAVEKVRESGITHRRHPHRARSLLRLQQPRRRHALAAHHALPRARRLRRHPLRPDTLSRKRGGPQGQAVSGGQPEFIPVLARAAVAAGVDGIFLEVHDNPAEAKSDGANALHLNRLRPVLETLLAIHAAVPPAE